MLKGHVFKQQIFGNQIFALFINTFLNGANGVSNNYKNSMEITYSGSTLTVQSGAVCIQGRFLEEDTSTDIAAGTESAYCKLVIEIDLSKQNTESDFQQGIYKVIKGVSAYPELTQSNIVKNNTGVYQYELARFRTTSNGITEFQDMRTYFDFNTIYNAIQTEYRAMLAELEEELEDVEDGSAYVLKNSIVNVSATIVMPEANSGSLTGDTTVNYPSGFTKSNTVVISLLGNNPNRNTYLTTPTPATSIGYIMGTGGLSVTLTDENIIVRRVKVSDSEPSSTNNIKITLMKVDSV